MPDTRHRLPLVRTGARRGLGLRLLAGVLALAGGLGAIDNAQAQRQAQAPAAAQAERTQSLLELYTAARGFDATYLSARASLDSAQYRVNQSYALRRPSLGLSAGASRALSDTPDASTRNSATNAVNATLVGSQTLFNRANDATITQSEKSLEVARSDFEGAEQALIVRVSQAYFDVLAAQDTLATTQSSLAAINEQVASAKRNFEVGTATITDTREAQARFDLARANQIAAENDLVTKRIALDQLVGRSDVAPRPLAAPLVLPALAPSSVEAWIARADLEHPAVRKARLNLDVARLETEKARAGKLPTVTLSGSYGHGHSATYGAVVPAGLTSPQPFSNVSPGTNSSIAVTLNMALFAGYAIQNRIRETLALEDKAQEDLEAARRGVAQATRTAFFGMRSDRAQVQALEAAESSSQLALEATQLGYKVGVRVNLDVLNAQAQLYTTQAQLAKARYNLVMDGLILRQASGRLDPADVTDVNRLLVP
ncbi:MAG: TolC family outer membrane protein [Burkholderiaceae bacterium]